ncbi:MAG: polysaccharide deacetylase family protein [Deltaproteobacteria bacterium]|nr:polysaccharide deacetylase family protein [Deltaproteobacteria bacterium]
MKKTLKRLILSAVPSAWILAKTQSMSDSIALTFDDGPHPINTPRILDILKGYNAKATFFLVGECVERHPEICKRMIAEGHDIGGHGQTHRILRHIPINEIRREIETSFETIRRCVGIDTRLFRPPHGKLGIGLLFYTVRHGITTVLWSISPDDWLETKKPDEILGDINRGFRGGDIVLLHDVMDTIVEMLPRLMETFKKKGIRFVKTSEMLGLSNPLDSRHCL